MIITGQIKDPRVQPLTTVTEVNISKDLGHAKVWVSRFGDRAAVDGSVGCPQSRGGLYPGRDIKAHVDARVPHLRFLRDDAMENGFRIAQKLREIKS